MFITWLEDICYINLTELNANVPHAQPEDLSRDCATAKPKELNENNLIKSGETPNSGPDNSAPDRRIFGNFRKMPKL